MNVPTRKTLHRPDPSLRFDPVESGLKEFSRDFFRKDTVLVAKRLLGAWLARKYRGEWYGARIVETEAYLGSGDAAAHSRGGRRTPRVEPMYSDGGHLYVFMVYGMHHCSNVVTRTEGIAEAVLLRAGETPSGKPAELLKGPGKLSRGLGITISASGTDLLASDILHLFHNDDRCRTIGSSRRIGVEYAGDAAAWPLRFFDRSSAAVSGPAYLRSRTKKQIRPS